MSTRNQMAAQKLLRCAKALLAECGEEEEVKVAAEKTYTDFVAEAYYGIISKSPALRTDRDFQEAWGKVVDWASGADNREESVDTALLKIRVWREVKRNGKFQSYNELAKFILDEILEEYGEIKGRPGKDADVTSASFANTLASLWTRFAVERKNRMAGEGNRLEEAKKSILEKYKGEDRETFENMGIDSQASLAETIYDELEEEMSDEDISRKEKVEMKQMAKDIAKKLW